MIQWLGAFFRKHWLGQIALLPTCLLTLLGLRLLLNQVSTARPQDWPFALALAFTLLSSLVFAWQLVGGVRAVSKVHDLLITTAVALAMFVTAALFLVSEMKYWTARSTETPAQPAPPAKPQPMVVRDGTVQITGLINFETLNRFDATLRARSDLRRVDLKSDGGHVPTARALAARIQVAGLATRAVGLCASACTLIFMAGKQRSIAPGAGLGFHAYRMEQANPFHSIPDEEARDRAYLRSRGVSESFIGRAFATSPDQLWRPTLQELRAAGLLAD